MPSLFDFHKEVTAEKAKWRKSKKYRNVWSTPLVRSTPKPAVGSREAIAKAAPKWYETEEGYPKEVVPPEVPVPTALVPEKPKLRIPTVTPTTPTVASTEGYGFAKPTFEWAKNAVKKLFESEEPDISYTDNWRAALGQDLNALAGWPWGKEKRGRLWKAVWGVVGDSFFKYMRQYVGFMLESNPNLAETAAIASMFGELPAEEWLREGTYVDSMLGSLGGPDFDEDEEINFTRKEFESVQATYGRLKDKYVKSGFSEDEAHEAAMQEYRTGKATEGGKDFMDEFADKVPWLTGLFDTGRLYTPNISLKDTPWQPEASWDVKEQSASNPLGASKEIQAAWERASGFRFSIANSPRRYAYYQSLLASGMPPKEAANLAEDSVEEAWTGFFLDPNWVLKLDNAVINATFKGVGAVAKGTWKLAGKAPVLKVGVAWATEVTRTSQALTTARKGKEAIQGFFKTIPPNKVQGLPEAAEAFFKGDLAPDAAGASLKYVRDAAGELAANPKYYDDLIDAIKAISSDDVIAKAGDLSTQYMARFPNQAADPLFQANIHNLSVRKIIEEIAEKKIHHTALELWDAAHPGYVARAKNPLMKLYKGVTSFTRGIMCDIWIGTRPAWAIYNYLDNAVKLALDGADPFSSLPDYIKRYQAYSMAPEQTDLAADLLRQYKFKFGTQANKEVVDILYAQGPMQAMGGFMSATDEAVSGSLLRKFGPTKALAEWVGSNGQRIELTMRARLYYTNFFKVLEDAMPTFKKGLVDGLNLTPAHRAVAESALEQLGTLTPEKVGKFMDALSTKGVVTVITPEMDEVFDAAKNLPQVVKDEMYTRLLNIYTDFYGSGVPTPVRTVKTIFNDAAETIAKEYDDTIARGHTMFNAQWPAYTDYTSMKESLFPMGTASTLEQCHDAIDQTAKYADEFIAASKKLDLEAIGAKVDELAAGTLDYNGFHTWLQDYVYNVRNTRWQTFIADEETLLKEVKGTLDGVLSGKNVTYPQDFIDTLTSLNKSANDNVIRFWKKWEEYFTASRGKSTAVKEAMHKATEKANKVYWDKASKILTEARADTLSKSREYLQNFAPKGSEFGKIQRGLSTLPDADSWKNASLIGSLPYDTARTLSPMYDDLRWIRQAIYKNNIMPVSTYKLSLAEASAAAAAKTDSVIKLDDLLDTANVTSVRRVNDVLFDYEKTENWMNLLNQAFPFMRFKTKSIPFWAEKFAEVPHLASSVAWIRRIQAEWNKKLDPNIPTRALNTIPIAHLGDAALWQYLGLDNTTLRINPWSFFSFMQVVPGTSQSSRDRLANIDLEEGEGALRTAASAFGVFANEMGFGAWPLPEYILGMNGFLGDDWYPSQLLGWYGPMVQFVASELFNRPDYDWDAGVRMGIVGVWNLLFGNTELAWEKLNPTLMQDWAAGRISGDFAMEAPPAVQEALVGYTLTEARQLARTLSDEQLAAYEKAMRPVFDMQPEEIAEAVAALDDNGKLMLLYELDKVSMRKYIRQQFATTIFGTATGLYFSNTRDSESASKGQRLERVEALAGLEPGPEYREVQKKFIDEHPGYILYNRVRFSDAPWETEAGGREAAIMDSIADDFRAQYFDFLSQHKLAKEAAIEEVVRKYPGQAAAYREVTQAYAQAHDEHLEFLNAELNKELQVRLEEYIEANPMDKAGIALLKEGWEIEEYVGVSFSSEERQKLREFQQNFPKDDEGFVRLYTMLYNEAAKRMPATQKTKVAGVGAGRELDLSRNLSNYSTEENWQQQTRGLLNELFQKAPNFDDYDDYVAYSRDKNTYMDKLAELAMETEVAKKQVTELMEVRGMTEKQATDTVAGWYTQEELEESWRANDTPYEALMYAYQELYIAEAKREYWDEIDPLRETDEDAYYAAKAVFDAKYPAIPAVNLVGKLVEVYPGRWTPEELLRQFEGITFPSYEDYQVYSKTGPKAVDAYLKYFYYKLPGDRRADVREAFGELFTNGFLGGEAASLSTEQKGVWLQAVSGMFGTPVDWKELPGMDDVSVEKQLQKEAQEFGLPAVDKIDMQEFERASALNDEYWAAMELGDDGAEKVAEIKGNAEWVKWFGKSTPKSMFWHMYYQSTPPGPMSQELRNNPIIKLIVSKPIRNAVATNQDYDNATNLILAWLSLNEQALFEADFDEEDYAKVRALYTQYNAIGYQNTEARAAFLKANPLLAKYLASGEDSEGSYYSKYNNKKYYSSGGGVDRGGRVDYNMVWSTFASRAGGALGSMLAALGEYWAGRAKLPPAVEEYLRKLYAELAPGMSFEDWLVALSFGYGKGRFKSSGGGGPKAPPQPYYDKSSRGYRR